MLISNFNLCKSEWLELVFEKRNKEYGAYYIRQHYADTLVKAMLIAFATMITAIAVTGVLIRVKPITERYIPVDLEKVFQLPPPAKVEPPKPKIEQPKAEAPKPSAPIKMVQSFPPVVTENAPDIDLPKIDDHAAVGPVTVKNGADGQNADQGTADKGGTGLGVGTAESPDKEVLIAEIMPQPVGGTSTWTKFLQSTMRYPRVALENEVSGRVMVGFIVEKDGHLSNIHVERGPGYGMDEEAARVLKLAKPWTPGMQNGRPVRVKLTLPVNFTFSE
ncbi:energy transducer TonB [Mucilaginibacter sp. UYCu711]|uniref:energy transducer TonB n=1 Tax=Mucilaginibacter sp. UYCu711 TaxID=3156339 RepID=UPI003D1DCBD5